MRCDPQLAHEKSFRREKARFSLGLLAAVLTSVMALLGFGASAASAAPEAGVGWAYENEFDPHGGFFPEIEPAPNAIALDGSGDVGFAETGSGYFYLAGPGATEPWELFTSFSNVWRNVAFDPSDNSLYLDETAAFGDATIHRYTSDGQSHPTYTLDPSFSVPEGAGIVIDPVTHDLLVPDPGEESIRTYDSAGNLVATISTAPIAPTYLATDPDGSFYIAPVSGPDVTHISSTGTVLGTISGAGEPKGLAWDSSDEVLIVAVAGGKLKTYNAAGRRLSESASHSASYGLVFDPDRVLLFQHRNQGFVTYRPITTPGVEAPTVTSIGTQSAHVRAAVDPGEGPPAGSVARFELSTDGGAHWTSTPEQQVAGAEMVQADLTELLPNTEYLVRVQASNGAGPDSAMTSLATAFSTPEIAPLTETGAAGETSESTAVLYGTVNPAGLPTSYRFEYGTSSSYGNRVPLKVDAPVGNRRVPSRVSQFVSGLQPGTTYHYRLVAKNAIGQAVGSDRTFTTSAAGEAFPPRAYEQVTPVDKGGATVLSNNHVQAARNGSAIAVTSVAASRDANSALIFQNYLSRRGTDGWLDWSQVDPPQSALAGLNESLTLAISEDFQHAFVTSNRVLAPGGIAGDGNFYVKDLRTGTYKFVGAVPADEAATLSSIQLNEKIFLAGAPDFSWLIFFTEARILSAPSPGLIYRWDESEGLSVVSTFPGGFVPPFVTLHRGESLAPYPVVSADGETVVYGFEVGEHVGPIFLRAGKHAEPTPVSTSHRSENFGELQIGHLDGLTPDGRYVFFDSESPLTEEASPYGGLYRYDTATDELLFIDSLAKQVLGFSDDGQVVYFDNKERGPEEEWVFQLKVWDHGEVRVIKRLGDLLYAYGVTKDGRYALWLGESQSGMAAQALLYDAQTNETVCVSCAADGQPSGGARFAMGSPIGNTQSQFLLEDGTVFFDSPTRLLPSDHNGTRDVYEYKEGHLALISPGDENYEAFFVGASEDGSSVFFQTNQGLVGQDVDGEADVYDARVGGGFPSQSPPPAAGSCKGAECAEAGAAPGTAPSVVTTARRAAGRNPTEGKAQVGTVTLAGSKAKVKVYASQPGRLKIEGALVKTTTRKLARPGTYTISVPLTAKVKAMRRDGKKVTLALRLHLSGGWGSSLTKYSKTFGK